MTRWTNKMLPQASRGLPRGLAEIVRATSVSPLGAVGVVLVGS